MRSDFFSTLLTASLEAMCSTTCSERVDAFLIFLNHNMKRDLHGDLHGPPWRSPWSSVEGAPYIIGQSMEASMEASMEGIELTTTNNTSDEKNATDSELATLSPTNKAK